MARAVRGATVRRKAQELSPSARKPHGSGPSYLRNGEPEKGLQQYRNLVQLDSTQPAYFREFGDALQQFGSLGEAQEIYRKMLETATDDNTRLDAVNRLAAVYVRNGQRDILLSEFQRRVSAAPKSLAAYQELAAVYRAAGDFRGAWKPERARERSRCVLRLMCRLPDGDLKVLAVYEALACRPSPPRDLDRLAPMRSGGWKTPSPFGADRAGEPGVPPRCGGAPVPGLRAYDGRTPARSARWEDPTITIFGSTMPSN
jgi:tetratricopeptide (TPR) repeat protein